MALIGESTTISVGGAAVTNVYSISSPEVTLTEVGKSVLGKKFKEYRVSNQYDAGTCEFSFYYDPDEASHTTITTWPKDDPIEEKAVVITFDGGAAVTFDAMPLSIKWEGTELDSELGCVVSLRIIGGITVPGESGGA